MDLSPEERRKIYLEEKAKEESKNISTPRKIFGFIIFIIGLLMLANLLFKLIIFLVF